MLNYNHESCTQMKNGVNCVIEATFGRIKTSNETVDVHINCVKSNFKLLDDVQFGYLRGVESVIWNGCQADKNLYGFGLNLLPRHSQVKSLQIEHFALGSVDKGVFDKFSILENLSLLNNFIENLSFGCFEGLKSLQSLKLSSNQLLNIATGILSDIPKLSLLEIHENSERLFIAAPQFSSNQVVNNISLAISRNSIDMELFEHLLSKSRNLSIIINKKNETQEYECEQTILNGYRRDWIVESLKLVNFKCGFIMTDVTSIKSLELNEILVHPYPGRIRLKGLESLEKLSMHLNNFGNFSSVLQIDDGSLRNLQILNLSYNQMYEFDIQVFGKCEKLERIDLVGNALSSLGNFNKDKFHILVDGNFLKCSWLQREISNAEFVFQQNFEGLNIRGLSCVLDQSLLLSDDKLPTPAAIIKLLSPKNSTLTTTNIENKNSIAVMSTIFICSLFLGIIFTFATIHIYNNKFRRQKQPFYHLLRGSLPLPATSHIRMGNVARRLPPTNYESPLFITNPGNENESTHATTDEADSPTTNTSLSEDIQNVYEEIPVRIH
jgi:hypothetical protein